MFRELDYQETPLGELILRERSSPSLGGATVCEVLLDGEYLMSSHVTASETALATLGIAAARVTDGPVLVGGLGLGITAATALDVDDRIEVTVVDALPAVIDWHRRGLIPMGRRLVDDPRCTIHEGDFFAWFDAPPAIRFRSILVDIDHSPASLLDAAHARFYEPASLDALRTHLLPGGSFALWSADEPTPGFLDRVTGFATVDVHPIDFDNPHSGPDRNWVVVAVAG